MPKLAELLDEINEKLPASKNIKNNSMTIFDLKWVNGVIENSSQPMINVVDLVPWFITQVKLWKDNRIIDEINLQIESREITVLGFFKNIYSEGANIFQQVSENFDDDCLFGIVSNEQIFNKYNAKDGTIILFKKFDENRVTFKGELTTDSLDNFINIHSLPLIVHYNSKYSNKIYTSVYENHLYIIKSKNDKNFDEFIEEISKSAREFRGNMMFVIFNPDNDNEIDFLANSLHIDKEYLPRIIFDGLLGDERILHKPENPDVNVENVEDFISRFRDDGLIKLYLTQDVPSDWDKEPVKIVARNNFADVILDENKNVLVLFYQPDIHLHLEWIMIEVKKKKNILLLIIIIQCMYIQSY